MSFLSEKPLCILLGMGSLVAAPINAEPAFQEVFLSRRPAVLGQGIDMRSQALRMACVEGHATAEMNPTTAAFLDAPLRAETLDSALGFSSSDRMSPDRLEEGNPLWNALRQRDGASSLTLFYLLELGGMTVNLSEPGLSVVGRNLLPHAPGTTLRANCGTHFLRQMEMGGRFLVEIAFQFKDASAKTLFLTETQADSASLFTLGGQVGRALDSDASLTITPRQWGGDMASFQTTFAQIPIPFGCSRQNSERCTEVLRRVTEYVSAPEGFRQQITASAAQGAWERLTPLKLMAEPYAGGALDGLRTPELPPLSFEEGKARRELFEQWESTLRSLREIEAARRCHGDGCLSEEELDQQFRKEQRRNRRIREVLQSCMEQENCREEFQPGD